ncbi:unnamed protein product [Hermetia illucens]|uniref:ALMS motif domain-containing protein n=1 Tax=Hermetia illucens TaxID=343691 RepID=A0A7R8YWS6_HERIL|nr:uncharacterized protein LOC119652985 [Hermetia illucens]CAD7085110.1 unnamed protein product [Hermetia illucens]
MKSDDELHDCSSVNATILEYYEKFGRDRRLEKYLRLREPIVREAAEQTKPVPILTVASDKLEEQPGAAKEAPEESPDGAEEIKPPPGNAVEGVTDSSQTDCDALEETQDPDDSRTSRQSKKSHVRLEWDSLGDVGYNKPATTSDRSDQTIKTLEKDILKEIFCSKENPTSVGPPTEIPSDSTKQKEKWQRTLETIRKKYDSQLLDASGAISIPFNTASFSDRSTPKPKMNRPNKSIQTSLVGMDCKEVQVSIREDSTSPLKSTSKYSTYSTSVDSQRPEEKMGSSSQTESSILNVGVDPVCKAQNEIELGIKLLCSLIESKNLSVRKKKLLARKIVSKINRRTANRSSTSSADMTKSDRMNNNQKGKIERGTTPSKGSSSSQGQIKRNEIVSGGSTKTQDLHSSNTSNSTRGTSTSEKETLQRGPKRQTAKLQGKVGSVSCSRSAESAADSMSAWLDPMTKSEFIYEKSHAASVVLVNKKASGDFVPTVPTKPHSDGTKTVWVDQKGGGDFIPLGHRRPSEIFDFITNERKSHLNWIENEIRHLENLKQLLLSNSKKPAFAPLGNSQQVYGVTTKPVFQENVYDKVATSSDPSLIPSTARTSPVIYHEAEVISEKEAINPIKLYQRIETRREHEILYDDVNQTGRTTSQTARSGGKSVTVEIQEEKRFPKRNYRNKHAEKQLRSKLETPTVCTNENLAEFVRSRKQQFLERCKKNYTRKTDSENSTENGHYSEPCEKSTSKQKGSGSEPCTTTTSSNFFVSSESISIPEAVTSSTTTTTHQYDHRTGIGIQTTESLLQTKRILNKDDGPTMRTYRFGRNKQTQTKPQSLAYVIHFESSCPSGSSAEFTLRDYLERRRPDFMEHTNQRCTILSKLRHLRKERDRQVREIIENTSITSIPRKLKELPPPPTKSTRVFATREMKAITKQKYSQLPEVVERSRRLKTEKTKKSNRIIADVFNKRIQQRVRKGKLNLDHSMTVI